MSSDLEATFIKLIEGQVKYQSSSLSLNLLISRLQKKYQVNRTPAELKNCLQEMSIFFKKYSSIMAKDIEALKKL